MAGSHSSNPGELLFISTIFGAFFLMGLYLFLLWSAATIEVDESGIRGRNLLGRVAFQSRWSEIDRLERREGSRGALTYFIYAGDRKLKIRSSMPDSLEIVDLVRRKCPQLDSAIGR
jgi:hypothetical protein